MSDTVIETKAFKGMTSSLTGFVEFQFTVGGIYEIDASKEIIPGTTGFHACINLVDCLVYYPNDNGNRFFEVTIFGEYKTKESKICARKIRINKEINPNEMPTGEFIDCNETRKFYVNGKLHRDGDLPAMIYSDGTTKYYKNGYLHRDGDMPAIIESDGGTQSYYKNGKLHRDGDMPAVIRSYASTEYYVNGQLHRDGNLPAVIHTDGSVEYYVNGHRHRDGDLPAIIYIDGTQGYYKHGHIHRDDDMPALIESDGHRWYFKNGKKYYPDP